MTAGHTRTDLGHIYGGRWAVRCLTCLWVGRTGTKPHVIRQARAHLKISRNHQMELTATTWQLVYGPDFGPDFVR